MNPPPSLLPPKKYCDITGLEAPYTDPKTTLRYHSKEIYGIINTLVSWPVNPPPPLSLWFPFQTDSLLPLPWS